MAQHARTPANAACGKTATCADAPYIAPTPDLGCLNSVFMTYLRLTTSLSSSSGSSPRDLSSGNDLSSSSAWQHAYDLLANSAAKVGVAPDAYNYALVAETVMFCGACSEAKHLYCEARRQFAHQVRLLDDLETKLWKVWSQRELWGIHESVRNDHKLLVDSHAWATLSAALHDAAANGTLLGGGFMDEGARAGYTYTCLGKSSILRSSPSDLPCGRISNPPTGELALCRIASLQLPCGRPELEVRPRRARSLGEPQNECSQRHATASTVVQLQKKIASKQVLVWTRGRIMFPVTHTSVLVVHHCPSPAAALSSVNFTFCLLLFSKNRAGHQTRF